MALVSCRPDKSTPDTSTSTNTNTSASTPALGQSNNSSTTELSKPALSRSLSGLAEEQNTPDLQRALDLVELHYGVKEKYTHGGSEGLLAARRAVDQVLAGLK
jgi:hypothetical protein